MLLLFIWLDQKFEKYGKFALGGLLTRSRDSFDGHNIGLLLVSKRRMPTGHQPAQ